MYQGVAVSNEGRQMLTLNLLPTPLSSPVHVSVKPSDCLEDYFTAVHAVSYGT